MYTAAYSGEYPITHESRLQLDTDYGRWIIVASLSTGMLFLIMSLSNDIHIVIMHHAELKCDSSFTSLVILTTFSFLQIYDVPPLHDLPEALSVHVMTFLNARDICQSIRRVDRAWR